jgi:RNA polymerase sigma-70 factor (ECF subfamily)
MATDDLLAHCYRLLGSVRDAQAVLGELPPTADVGTATTACLSRLDRLPRRPLPTTLGGQSDDPEGKLHLRPEVLWLEPLPDHLAGGDTVSLDVAAALQRLEPRQRAALTLYDVQGWSAVEIGRLLGPADELLEQARLGFDAGPDGVIDHHRPDQQAMLARYAASFEQYDVDAIVALFSDDAVWEMPPYTSWFRGAKNIGRLISTHCPAKAAGDQVLVAVEANGQPGFAVYMRDPVEEVHRAFQIQVLTLTAAGIAHAIAFFDLSLFDAFGLPELLSGLPDSATLRPAKPTIEVRYQSDEE